MFVLSLNLHHRHLTSSQKAVLALDVEKLLAKEAAGRQIALAGTRPNSQGQDGQGRDAPGYASQAGCSGASCACEAAVFPKRLSVLASVPHAVRV